MGYINHKWIQIKNSINYHDYNTTGINYNAFNTNIYNATCFINNYTNNDVLNISTSVENFIDTPLEIKKEQTNFSYWENSLKTYLFIPSNNILNNLFINQTLPISTQYIYLCSSDKKNYFNLKKDLLNNVSIWVYYIENESYLKSIQKSIKNLDYIYIKDMNIFVQYNNGLFYSKFKNNNGIISSFTDYIIASGLKNSFNGIILDNNHTYLTTDNDCDYLKNCSGENGLYNGKKYYNLFSWKVFNNTLEDIKKTTFYNGYNKKYNKFLDNNIVYTKVFDNFGNICYTDGIDFYYKNKNKVEKDFILKNKLNFPLSNINCSNTSNHILYANNLPLITLNNLYTGTYININKIEDLKKIVVTPNTVIGLYINHKKVLFKKIGNQFVSYKYVIGLNDRNSLNYINDFENRIYYTFNLGIDTLINNGTYNKNLKLYTWLYDINNSLSINGFIDLIQFKNLNDAYIHINNIIDKVKINNVIFQKENATNGINNFYCLKDTTTNILYNADDMPISANYLNYNNGVYELKVPKNIN